MSAPSVIARRNGSPVWTVLIVLNAVLLVVAVFLVTQSVKKQEAHVRDLNRQILAEQQAIRVLDAEWAYLTRPQRLEELIAMREKTVVQDIPTLEKTENTKKEIVSDVTPPVQSQDRKPEPPKIVKIKPVRQVTESIAKPDPLPAAHRQKKVQQDMVWPIAHVRREASAKPEAQTLAQPRRAGVAKPIVE